jgi:hypothetical protein
VWRGYVDNVHLVIVQEVLVIPVGLATMLRTKGIGLGLGTRCRGRQDGALDQRKIAGKLVRYSAEAQYSPS